MTFDMPKGDRYYREVDIRGIMRDLVNGLEYRKFSIFFRLLG